MRQVKIRRAVGGILTVGIMILIFCMSAQDGTRSSDTSGGVVEFVLRLFVPNFEGVAAAEQTALVEKYHLLIRKLAHFSIFLSLGLSCSMVTLTLPGKKRPVQLGLAALVGLLYAISDEIHQRFVPGRAGVITDVLIDFSGVLTGLLALWLVLWCVEKKKGKKITLQG